MKFFNKEKTERTIIAGCGGFGIALACAGLDQNQQVTVIDKDAQSFYNLPESFRGYTIEGDATDAEVLEMAGIRSADVLIAATDDDSVNLMISQIARQRYNVKNIISRIYDTSRKILYDQMNITVVCPVQLSVREAEKVWFHREEEKAV